jgi:tRNA threonylcarbamoyladenosine biosynthesis protein TsaE
MEMFTQSPQQTQALGEKIGLDLKKGKIKQRVLCFYGDLGAGKTTFIQGLAKGWGIKRRITSPTFVFIKKYFPGFNHVDLYRIEKEEEVKGLGLEEMFVDSQEVTIIEWAEKIKNILPKERIDFYFDYISDKKRKITINYF